MPRSKSIKKKMKLRSVRERKFVKTLAQTGEIGRSAVMAGYSGPEYGSKLLKQDRVRSAVLEALEEAGLGDSYIATKLKEGCESVYPIKRASNGQIIQGHEPDYFTRAIYVDKVLKIRGDYAPEKHELTEKKIVVVITPELVKGLVDTEAITEAEVEEIKALPKHEE